MKIRRILPTLLAAALAATALSGCGEESAGKYPVPDNVTFASGTTMKALQDKGSIKIGVPFESAGFGFKDPVNNKVEGFDIELATYIVAKLGIPANKIEWVHAVAANKESFIQNGTVDMVVAQYAITDERKKSVSFAGPYLIGGQTLLVASKNTTITGPDDVKGKKVCSTKGSVTMKNIEKYQPQPVPFDTFGACVDQLSSGQVDAVTGDLWILAGFATQRPNDLKIVGKTFTESKYGIGVKKDDKVFRDWLCDQIGAAVTDGTWKKIVDGSFGKANVGNPVAPTPEKY